MTQPLFDRTLLGDDLAARGNAVYRQMTLIDWPGLVADFEKAIAASQDFVATADSATGGRAERRGSGISDPAWSLALARAPHLATLTEIVARMVTGFAHLNLARREIASVRLVADAAVLADAVRAIQCGEQVSPAERLLPGYDPLCGKNAVAKGRCQAHYMAWRRYSAAAGQREAS